MNPEDVLTIEPFVAQCVLDKIDRKDYSTFVSNYCVYSSKDIRRMAKQHVIGNKLDVAIRLITVDVSHRFRDRNLRLENPIVTKRVDGMSGKVRDIALESIMQQVMEHVIVGCMTELWNKRLCVHQYASIKGKGQTAGALYIQKWTKAGQADYFVKGDVNSCFGSFEHKRVMAFLRRDIGKNKKLLWCVEALLKYHSPNGVGLLIGSLLSQFLCNYLLSFVYRYAESLGKFRRGKRIKLVMHVLFYMDDFLLTGNDRRNLMIAIRSIERYMHDRLGITIKLWNVKNHLKEGIDMMGFVVRGNGRIKVRHRIFRRARRAFMRLWYKTDSLKCSRRVTSYFGYLKYANIKLLKIKKGVLSIRVKSTISLAANNIRMEDRRQLLCAA